MLWTRLVLRLARVGERESEQKVSLSQQRVSPPARSNRLQSARLVLRASARVVRQRDATRERNLDAWLPRTIASVPQASPRLRLRLLFSHVLGHFALDFLLFVCHFGRQERLQSSRG